MTRSPLLCCTSIIRSSPLVQASSSLSMICAGAWPTGATRQRNPFPPAFIHCPRSSHLSHPAILSLARALRRYYLCSWSSHTPLQQTAILLGSSLPELLRKHDKAWTLSTSSTCAQLIYSLQSQFFKHQASASPGPVPSLKSPPASPPSDDTQCQVCESLLDEEKMLLCDICNAGWHMDNLIPTLNTIPAGI